MDLTKEQQQILDSNEKRVVVSASAGSGKTFVLIEKLISLICDKKVPVERLLVLTFTKAAAKEMKSRLLVSMLSQKPSDYLLQQIDDLSISDISTIDSFCEKIIKRNINKLDIDEGFTILDERG
ncbi:MAG: UvrD-helicase domain-containing protein, partial [Clostridia bacterium]|nr:UvrD-helicase domain-containing protein [Clostridia bacterium]